MECREEAPFPGLSSPLGLSAQERKSLHRWRCPGIHSPPSRMLPPPGPAPPEPPSCCLQWRILLLGGGHGTGTPELPAFLRCSVFPNFPQRPHQPFNIHPLQSIAFPRAKADAWRQELTRLPRRARRPQCPDAPYNSPRTPASLCSGEPGKSPAPHQEA